MYGDKKFFGQLNIYRNRWNYKNISAEDMSMLFAVYHISNGYINLKYVVKNYTNLFTTYDYINEDNQMYGLHELLRQTIREFEVRFQDELLPYKRSSKLLKIKNMLN